MKAEMEKSIAPQILGGNSISGYCPPERQQPHLTVVEMNCSHYRSLFWRLLVCLVVIAVTNKK